MPVSPSATVSRIPGTSTATTGTPEAIASTAASPKLSSRLACQKQAAPEVVAAVRSGDISLNAAAVVATLPTDEQRAAALAGKDELKQAAKRVRESRRKPRDEPAVAADSPATSDAPASERLDADYLAVWKAPAHLLQEQTHLKGIINLGAGVDHLLNTPGLPDGVPIVKLRDAGMSELMADYVLYGVLHFYRSMDRYRQQQTHAPEPE